MKPLPRSEQAIVLRTDFSDEAAWQATRLAIGAPVRENGSSLEFLAYVTFVDDPDYRDLDTAQVRPCSSPTPTTAS